MHNPYYFAGIIVGILIGLLILFFRKKNRTDCQYDERQLIGRGKAHQAGFYTLLAGTSVVSFMDYLEILPGTPFYWHFAALALGIAVFVVTAIHYDAYVSMTDKPDRFYKTGGLLALAMLPSAISCYSSGNNDGFFMSTTVLLLWIVVITALFLHGRKQAEEDAE